MSPVSSHSLGPLACVVGLLLLGGLACQNNDPSPSDSDTSEGATTSAEAPASATAGDSLAPASSSGDTEAPEGMVYVPSGSTQIGVETERWEELRRNQPPGPRMLFGKDAHPPFWADVSAFYLDEHPVTVEQFRAFVEETNYTTQAEEFGSGGVLAGGQWRLLEGATWRQPRGPGESAAPDDHPVTQVSWNDAEAYCEWAGKRLPTEVEWEHAAREGRNDRSFCPWDGSCQDQSALLQNANTWQGQYPFSNTAEDGYRYTSPVGAFGATELGLQDMSGNVWEWTSSWKRPYEERGTDFTPGEGSERVQRGGSFICRECKGYYVFSRSSSTPNTSLFHVGFRCARDASAS